MTLKVKNAGAWVDPKELYVKQAGVWVPVKGALVKQAGVWTEVYSAVVVAYVTESVNNLNIQSLFDATDWAATKKKKVIINPGVIIGSTDPSVAAVNTGSGRGGLLEIDNFGDIRAAGGAANGGQGGNAINVQQAGLTLTNNGYIRAGGGGGGRGGTGGTGGTGTYTARQPTSGSYYNSSYKWTDSYSGSPSQGYTYWRTTLTWNGSTVYQNTSKSSPKTISGYTYYKGSLEDESSNGGASWGIYRTYSASSTGGAGGAGGDGGVGRGFNQSAGAGQAGDAGVNGGTNAGKGGTGGTGGIGGEWGVAGVAGSSGNTGASGNSTSGTSGSSGFAGGQPGAAVTGLSRTVFNNGTIQGAI